MHTVFLLLASIILVNSSECPRNYKNVARRMDTLNQLMAKYTCKDPKKDATTTTTIATTIPTTTTTTKPTTKALSKCGSDTKPFVPIKQKEVFCVIKPDSFVKNGFSYEHFDWSLCTIIIIAFSVKVADNKDYEMRLLEENGPIDKIVKYCKVYDMKVLFEIGSFETQNYAPSRFSKMANNRTARELFVNNTLALMQRYEFDGIFLRWLYPVCWFVVCTAGKGYDKPNFSALLRYMTKIIRSEGKLVVIDAPSNTYVIKTVFELSEVLENIDYMVIYAAEYSGDWSPGTAITAPFKSFAGTLKYYIDGLKISTSKLMVVINSEITPVKLSKNESTRIGSPIRGRGSLNLDSYAKVCLAVKTGGNFFKGSDDDNYAYAYKDGTWASYDSVELVRQKMAFLNNYENFGGVVFRFLSDDDFNGTLCNSGRYPLLRTINEELRGSKVPVNSFP